MMTPAEYNALPLPRKRDYALAVDALERMCAEMVATTRRAQTAMLGVDGRAEAERCEIAAMCQRNAIFARQLEYAMSGISLQIATDDRGNPIRVRRPLGFVSLDALAAKAAKATPLSNGKNKKRRTK